MKTIETSNGGKEYELFGCKLVVSKDECLYVFKPSSANCREKLSLAKTFDSLFNRIAKLGEVMKKFLPILIYTVEEFTLDKCTGEIGFEAKAREPFDVVKNRLRVSWLRYNTCGGEWEEKKNKE